LENLVLKLRRELKENSVLGEYGAVAIRDALPLNGCSGALPSVATINRILSRHGVLDGHRRTRRPPPPKGWYLPTVAEGCEELDSFDFIEDLKIKDGPLVCLLTGISLLEGLSDAWVQEHRRAESTVKCLLQRWQRDGLPGFAQFDNDTVFQGAHQFPDAIGRVTRLCLALGVTPVFAPPREPGFQNAIEGFNGLWQSKVWRRIQCSGIVQMQESSDRYVRAHRNRNASRRDTSPSRKPFPDNFYFDPKSPMQGTVIFLRRTDEEGRAQLLGRSFAISSEWCHRLVRCEVDLNCRRIRVYALRRREPAAQPLLVSIPYRRIQKRSFQG
jgi:hypothetical protein